jgi:hypothetical protein
VESAVVEDIAGAVIATIVTVSTLNVAVSLDMPPAESVARAVAV